MIFRFFDTKEISAFAASIVADYDKLQRSSALRDDSADKLRQRRDKLSQKIDQYCREQNLNFYKKAKMIHAIQSGMAEKGIAQEDIQLFLNSALMKSLPRA